MRRRYAAPVVDAGRRRTLRALAALAAAAGGGTWAVTRLGRDGDDAAAPTGDAGPSPSAAPSSAPEPAAPPETATTTAAEPATTTTETAAPAPAASAVMLCRDAWGAAAPTHQLPPHDVTGLLVHHTAVVHTSASEGPARVRGHQGYHQRNGFSDIAYHAVIDAGGNVYEGRDPSQPGETFTEYETRGWYLVTCEGHFDQQPLGEAQFESLCLVLAWAGRRFGVDPTAVRAHRDVASTTCPGASLHARFTDGSLARRVGELAGRGVDLARLCGPEGAARVAAIERGTA